MTSAHTANLIVLNHLEGNVPASLSPVQQFIAAHEHAFEIMWWAIFFSVFAIILLRLGYLYKNPDPAVLE